MTLHQAFRYELEPTVRRRRLLAKAAGTARYAFAPAQRREACAARGGTAPAVERGKAATVVGLRGFEVLRAGGPARPGSGLANL